MINSIWVRGAKKSPSFTFVTAVLAATFLMSGFFVAPSAALAAATVTAASGGTNISIDTTSAPGGSGVYKTLSGPSITETAPGDISVGTHVITLPAGWEFNTGSTVTVVRTAGDIEPDSQTITPDVNSFTFTITGASTENSGLAFIISSMKVRPTGTAPSTGNMAYSGSGIAGVDGSTNFGTLSTVAGTVTQLAFTTEPGGAVYGSLLSPQPVVKNQDQFGNNSTNGLVATEMVALTLTSGTGVLQGAASLDIGTGAGNGTVTFTDLMVDEFGTGKQLTASASGLASDVSGDFEITKKPITATLTAENKDYDGTTAATTIDVSLVDVEVGDDVTVDSEGTATFNTPDADTGKTVTATGVTITGADADNYSFGGTAIGTADITPLEISVTPNTEQAKVYGEDDPIFTYTSDPLIAPDTLSGALDRAVGEDVGDYAYTLGTLSAGDNYTLTLASETFEITQKPLTVTATGVNREYDQTTSATVTLSSADEETGDGLIYAYTSASFLDKMAEDGKMVNVSGISISGAKSGNYNLLNTEAVTTANITKKSITATINLDNKTYNGNTNAVYSSTNPRVANGVIAGDVVVVENTGSKAFIDKHVGIGKTVNATGLTLSGADAENYEFDGTGTGTATISARPITVTAVTDTRTYNGTDVSTVLPAITSGALQGSDTAGFTQTFDTKHVGDGKMLTPSGSVNDDNSGANYAVTFETVLTGEITVKSINVTAQPDTKVYDGTTASDEDPIVDLLEDGDSVGIAPTQSYDTEDVDTGKTLEAIGLVVNDGNSGNNYFVTYVDDTTGVVTAKGLTVTGATTVSKIYDGDADAEVDFSSATLNGVVAGEEGLVSLDSSGYSATYDNENVATGKTVTVSGLALAGAGASNYSLTQPELADGEITQRTLIVTASGTTKVYDSTLDATDIVTLDDDRVAGDVLTLTHTAAFETKDVGDDKPVHVTGIAITGGADAGNYTLNGVTTAETTADITPATLTATVAVEDKVYDGSNSATITGHTFDVIGTDIVTVDDIGTATFENANVGVDKDVSAVGITVTGADAGNYSYDGTASGNADITPLEITGSFTANNKVYDGNTTATILTRSLTGVLPLDEGNVVLTGGTAEFADANVDNDIIVTEIVAMTLTGSAASNYELTDVVPTTANITKAPLTITADDKDREYGNANPTLTASYEGFADGEDEDVLDTPVTLATLADVTSVVGEYDITASGAEDTNYEITHVDGTLTINPAPIDIMPDEDQGKTYGDSDEEITYTASGFKNGEDESVFTGALGRDPGENADDYDITLGTLDVGDNYVVDSFFDVFYTIEQRPLTITAVTDTKIYDGNTTSDGMPTIVGDLQFGQSSGFTQTYDTKDVGENKTLTPAGIVNDGNGGANYSYTFIPDLTGEITALGIVVTPNAGQTKVYGEVDLTFAYTFDPALIGGDEFTGALSRIAGEDVGIYAYELGSLTASGNYILTLASGTFAVTKATPVIDWENPEDITYGTALDGTQLNAETGIDGAFVYTPVSGTVLSAGDEQELSAIFTPTDTLNYNSADASVLINVNPAPLEVMADDHEKEYGEDDPALTYTFDGLVNGDTTAVFSGALERVAGESVGEYDINQGTLSAGDNYEISYASGTLTIEDTVAPSVISHTPSLNALNISPTTPIIITFSEAVDVESGDISFSPTISGGFIIENSGTNVVTITPVSPLADNTTYTITLDGVADVNGNSLPTYSNIKFTTATTYSIDLNANASGWNLLSLPVIPSNTAIATVLGGATDDIDAVWTYDPTNPNAVDGWLVFVPGNPEGTNNLTTMTAGFGYWVSVTDDANVSGSGTLLIAGPTPPPSRSLEAGWNLIGYYQLPDEDSSTPAAAFVSLGGSYTGLWGFDNTTGSFNSVETINPSDAFWISLPSAQVYTPSNVD